MPLHKKGAKKHIEINMFFLFYIKNFNASNKRNPREVFPGIKIDYFI